MIYLKYDNNNNIYFYTNGERRNISTYAHNISKNYICKKDLCHRISFHCIEKALINALNYFIKFSNTDTVIATAIKYISGIIIAVCGPSRLGVDISCKKDVIYFEALSKDEVYSYIILSIKRDMEEYFSNPNDSCKNLRNHINEILFNLANELFNLHIGASNVNRSIGVCFDPSDGITIYEDNNNIIFELGDNDSFALSWLLHGTLGGGPKFDQSSVYFLFGNYCYDNNNYYNFVYQSNNYDLVNIIGSGEVNQCNGLIIYHNIFTGEDVICDFSTNVQQDLEEC